jgi:tyrosinase
MALRKNRSTLSAAEKTAFVEAVLAQKQRPSLLHPGAADRTRYDDFVEVHLNAMAVMMQSPPAPSWGHMAAAFCAWHRALLQEFERELQTVDPSVTLPAGTGRWIVRRTPACGLLIFSEGMEPAPTEGWVTVNSPAQPDDGS